MTLIDLLALTAIPLRHELLADVYGDLLRSRMRPTELQRAGRAARPYHGGEHRHRIGRYR